MVSADATSNTADHWDATYSAKEESGRSWTEEVPLDSLSFIARAGVKQNDAIIDVGGGASHLVDELVARGYANITVLDVSPAAFDESRRRVDDDRIEWITTDVTTWKPGRTYDLWHDRAVFHFLTTANDQAAYVKTATSFVAPGGHVILATFAPAGPTTCSGLEVRRWSGIELADLFSDGFTLEHRAETDHVTPWGTNQPFTWVLLERRR